jgi:hypothetical protein
MVSLYYVTVNLLPQKNMTFLRVQVGMFLKVRVMAKTAAQVRTSVTKSTPTN